jgi:uncharacterized protein
VQVTGTFASHSPDRRTVTGDRWPAHETTRQNRNQMKKPVVAGLAAAVGAAGLATYQLRRPLWQRLLKLPPAEFSVTKHSNLRVAMPDGVSLATDLYRPQNDGRYPTILVRTPYGRSNPLVDFAYQRLAERGYNVVSQDCRGRFGSEGVFEPYVHEAEDGRATIDWIAGQPWSDGQVAMWGRSYVGYVQWAAASTGSPHLKALVPSITMAHLGYDADAGFKLDRTLRWLYILDALQNEQRPAWQNLARMVSRGLQDRVVARGYDHLPLSTLDEAVLGRPVPTYRTWIEHSEPEAAYWQAVDFRPRVRDVELPIHLVAGWYDIFLDGQLADYAALVAAGRQPYLTVGPWAHMDPELPWETLRVGIDWFDAHLKGKTGRLRPQPVRLYVMGADEWREYDSWPPPAGHTPYFLHENGFLSPERPTAGSPPDRYRYDPADPTPHVGGALLSAHAGARDNRVLEARPDVLTYTTEPLVETLEIIGPLRLQLYVRSNRAHTDFVGRLCDVWPDGRSMNISDGFFRIRPGKGVPQPDGTLLIEMHLSPTAYCFQPGHRLRLQVASGAHPRIARNPGTGEYNLYSAEMVTADQELFHDEARPSALILPIFPGRPASFS